MLLFMPLILSILSWLLVLGICADSRSPEGNIPTLNKELSEKSRLRRILKYIMPLRKNDYNNPYIYVKAIPYFIYFIYLIAVVILYILYAVMPNVMYPILSHPVCLWISVGIVGLVFAYGCAIKFV